MLVQAMATRLELTETGEFAVEAFLVISAGPTVEGLHVVPGLEGMAKASRLEVTGPLDASTMEVTPLDVVLFRSPSVRTEATWRRPNPMVPFLGAPFGPVPPRATVLVVTTLNLSPHPPLPRACRVSKGIAMAALEIVVPLPRGQKVWHV